MTDKKFVRWMMLLLGRRNGKQSRGIIDRWSSWEQHDKRKRQPECYKWFALEVTPTVQLAPCEEVKSENSEPLQGISSHDFGW